MAVYNLGTARGQIQIDTNDLKNADIALRSAGTSMVGFGAAALGAFGYVVGVGAKFEKEMDTVSAVTGATREELDKLSKAAIELGKQGPFGPREVAAGFVDLAKAGLSAQEIIDGVGEAAVNLAAAGDIPFTQAAETLVNVMRTFNIEGKDVAKTVDVIAGAANASTIDVDDLATSLKYAGAPAAALGVNINDLSAAIGILGNRGIRGSTAGTSLRRVFLQLANPTQVASDRMKELGLITEDGANAFFTAEGKAKSLAEIFQILKTATAGLNDQQKIAALNDIFGARAVNSALILMEQGADGFAAFEEQMLNTSAADVAAEKMDNLSGAMKRLRAAIEAVFIQAGSPFQDFLKNLVNILREVVLWFGNLPRPIQTGILAAIALVGVLSILSGVFLLTVGNMIRAVRIFGELGKSFETIQKIVPALSKGFAKLNAVMSANPYILIILAIIAIGIALYQLYKHNEKFRKFVDGLWQGLQRFWDKVLEIVKAIPEAFGLAWKNLKKMADDVWDDIYAKVTGVIDGIVDWVQKAPGRMLNFFQELPGKLGKLFADLGKEVGKQVANAFASAGDAVADFFRKLPRRAGYAIGYIIGKLTWLVNEGPRLIGEWIVKSLLAITSTLGKWKDAAIQLGIQFLTGLGEKFLELRAWLTEFFLGIINWLIEQGPGFAVAAGQIGWSIISGIGNFLNQLPGMMARMVWDVLSWLNNLWNEGSRIANEIGSAILHGIVDFIANLPSLVWDILQRVIGAFLSLVKNAFNAAKDFASGLWNGFKDGLGINSPSLIEKSMFAIQDEAGATNRILTNEVNRMNMTGQRINPLNSGALGLTTPAAAAAAAGAGGLTIQQNAPLIGQASIRSDDDIVKLARQLAVEQAKQARAKGRVPSVPY